MYKKVYQWVCLCLGLLFLSPSFATLVPVEGAVEAMAIELLLTKEGRGQVSGRECDRCKVKSFSVNAETKMYRGERLLSVAESRRLNGRSGTILYDLKSRKATRIFW
ncbi:MAG: hypothetical protein Q9O24_05050 [Gammaproteobacteria bacterium]|nr:hypothetical protein [Gammaproteobacteria bacterium]